MSAESLVMYRLGGQNYPLLTDPRCKTCRSPYRIHIESEVIAGRPLKMIVDSLTLQDSDVDLSVPSVRNHIEKHMPAKHAQMRRIAEHRAERRGKQIEQGLDSLVDGLTMAEAIVTQGYEDLRSGKMRLKPQHVIAAARLMETFEGDSLGIDEMMFLEAFIVYHDTVRRLMEPDQFRIFGEMISENETLQRLQEAWELAQSGKRPTIAGETVKQGSLTEEPKAG